MLKLNAFLWSCYIFNILFLNWLVIFRKNSFVYKFFYSSIKHIINKQKNPKYTILHLFNEFLYLFFTIRFIKIWIYMANPNLYSDYDFFNIMFQVFSDEKDYFFVCIFVFLFLFCFLIEPLLYFTPVNTITFLKYSDLVVDNYDLYKKYSSAGNFSVLQKETFVDKNLKLFKFYSFEIDQTVFCFSKLKHFPNLSFNLRVRFVKLLVLIEKLCMITIIGVCKFLFTLNKAYFN